jgi:hypothetical protein
LTTATTELKGQGKESTKASHFFFIFCGAGLLFSLVALGSVRRRRSSGDEFGLSLWDSRSPALEEPALAATLRIALAMLAGGAAVR